jgi:small GTP-binding protein
MEWIFSTLKGSMLSKIVIVGSGGVGKTCIATRLITGTYLDSKMTIGLEIESWGLVDRESGESFKIVSYDFGGQPQFRFFQDSMITGAKVGVVVFDLSRFESLFEIDEWIKMLGSTPKIVVGNKADLEHEVQEEDIQEISEKYNTSVIQVSAMSGTNMDTLVDSIINLLRGAKINS